MSFSCLMGALCKTAEGRKWELEGWLWGETPNQYT